MMYLRRICRTLEALLMSNQAIERQLARILETLVPGPAVKLVFTAHLEDGTSVVLKEGTIMTLRDDQKQTLSIQPVDVKGKPAAVDGVPVWAGSDDTVLTVEAASDGMSAVVTAVSPGTARVVVTADADLGSGVTPLTGVEEYTITGGTAVALVITPAPPANQ